MEEIKTDDFTDNVYVIRLTNGMTVYGVISNTETFEDEYLFVLNPLEMRERFDEEDEQYHIFVPVLPHADSNILPFHRDNILVYSKVNEKFTDTYLEATAEQQEQEFEESDIDDISPEHMNEYLEYRNRLQLGHIVTATLGRKH